jgi:transposase
MIAERILHPCSKLATTRLWHTTTLAEQLNVADADVDELYDALDWLLARQKRIEKNLAKRHLRDGDQALYDVSSSYYEGRTCVLAVHGHNRDGKKGLPIIVYGVMTDADGRPIAVDVYPGNTGDSTTVPDQVDKLRCEFGLSRVVLVGDRGMLTQTQIDNLKQYPQLGWISALRTGSIRKLAAAGTIQMSLFDQQNLAEIESPDFPDERLVVCFNPLLAEERARKREDLLRATERALDKIARAVRRRTRTPLGRDEIALRVGRVVNRFKVAKHFELVIEDGRFEWARNADAIAREAALDGIYVIRTSEPSQRLSAEDTVRSYKNLSHVERAFRTLKGIDLRVRPIRHRTEDHVRAHIFLCLLAYYVEWHMRKAWAPLLFDDEELDADRQIRDPVAPAKPSRSATKKKTTRRTTDGLPVHSFDTLLAELGTRCRNRCRTKTGKTGFIFDQISDPSPLQKRALELLRVCPVRGKST